MLRYMNVKKTRIFLKIKNLLFSNSDETCYYALFCVDFKSTLGSVLSLLMGKLETCWHLHMCEQKCIVWKMKICLYKDNVLYAKTATDCWGDFKVNFPKILNFHNKNVTFCQFLLKTMWNRLVWFNFAQIYQMDCIFNIKPPCLHLYSYQLRLFSWTWQPCALSAFFHFTKLNF